MPEQMNEHVRRLNEYRTAHKLSREKVAGQLGVTSSTLYRWEKGVSAPRGLYEGRLREFLKEVESGKPEAR